MILDRFRSVCDLAPFCVHEIAPDGRLLSMNPAGLALVGVRDEAAVRGRNFLAFVSPADRGRVRRLMEQALAGHPCVFELSAASTSQPRHFVSCFIPCADARGGIDRLLGMSLDVSRMQTDQRTIGVIGLLSSRRDAFTDSELALLTQLVQDLSFGIQSARARAVQAQEQCRLRDEAEADARKRLAAALHDEVGQSLQAVNLGLKRVRAMACNAEAVPEGLLDSLVDEVGAALRAVCEIGQELRPLSLERLPFADAVRLQCSDTASRTGIDIQMRIDGPDLEPDERAKYQCFMGFREALSNAVRHAGANRIRVWLRRRPPGLLIMTIADDGSGFDLDAALGQAGGLGLCSLRERTERVGGSVSIHSRAGLGTQVRISIPLDQDLATCR